MCDPEGCSTVWGAVGGGGDPHPPPKGGGGPPPPWLTQTQHLFRQAPSKRVILPRVVVLHSLLVDLALKVCLNGLIRDGP